MVLTSRHAQASPSISDDQPNSDCASSLLTMTGAIPKELADPIFLSELVLGDNELDGEKEGLERTCTSIERPVCCGRDV